MRTRGFFTGLRPTWLGLVVIGLGHLARAMEPTAAEADNILNGIYKDLMRVASPAQQKRIREAERAWVAYKDLDAKAAQAMGAEAADRHLAAVISTRIRELSSMRGGGAAGADPRQADAQLNAAYRAAMQNLAEPQQARLKAAQRAWIEFRNLHVQACGGSAAALALATENRAALLSRYAGRGSGAAAPMTAETRQTPPAPAVDNSPIPDPFATAR